LLENLRAQQGANVSPFPVPEKRNLRDVMPPPSGGMGMGIIPPSLLDPVSKEYRAAADILAAAFPSVGKGFDKLVGTPWANKSSMGSFLKAIERAEPGKNGYTAKQQQARDFVRALRTIPALAADVSEAVTIDATPNLRRAA
jgi:hypothetical protein